MDECQRRYDLLVKDIGTFELSVVNTASLTAHYHYAIFMYEIKESKDEAIVMLKKRHQEVVNRLDEAYQKYIDSYDIIDVITETLTSWIIENNYSGVNNLNE